MPLYVALLLSLTLHALLFIAPTWMAETPHAPVPSIEAKLIPLPPPLTTAEAVATEPSQAGADAAAPRPAALPRNLQGSALRRAQAALSEHLFYPPEAVARGLEGEVILLLTLTESGQLASAEIARSSGHALLDQAALEAARSIGALPGSPRQTLFPVNFRLQ
jgi:protein TonB